MTNEECKKLTELSTELTKAVDEKNIYMINLTIEKILHFYFKFFEQIGSTDATIPILIVALKKYLQGIESIVNGLDLQVADILADKFDFNTIEKKDTGYRYPVWL